MDNIYTIRIYGKAGGGFTTLGRLISNVFLLKGYEVYGYKDYQSLIKGGDNFFQISISNEINIVDTDNYNFMIAMDNDFIEKYKDLSESNIKILLDSEIGNEFIKSYKDKNIIYFLAFCRILSIDIDLVKKTIKKIWNKENIIKDIFSYIDEYYYKINININVTIPFSPKTNKELDLFTGNEAIAEGAIQSEIGYYSAYPMTPITGIYSSLVSKQTNIVLYQPEDEIAVINSALGASYTGVRSMVATSGGGFALMSEAIGNAIMAELPIVIVLGQRAGPSTGMPTYNGQGDLNVAIVPTFGDIQHVVLSPSDIYDCFELVSKAFNLADKYQLPVIVLTDKNLLEGEYSVDKDKIVYEKINKGKLIDKKISEEYQRYKISKDGISPRSIPGTEGCQYLSTSYEHDENSQYTEDGDIKIRMSNKRANKLKTLFNDWEGYKLYGYGNDKKRLYVTFGSNKATTLKFGELYKRDVLILLCLHPLPVKIIELMKEYEEIVVIEQNQTQMLRDNLVLLTENKNIKGINKYNGRPFYEEDLKKYE